MRARGSDPLFHFGNCHLQSSRLVLLLQRGTVRAEYAQSRRLLPMIHRTSLLVPALALFMAAPAFASEWSLDPMHSSVQFKVKHMMVSEVPGQFDKFSGTIALDDKDATKSSIDVTIEAASINTHQEKRDAHLKSPDFFDVAKYPQITFKSTKIAKKGKGFAATGD